MKPVVVRNIKRADPNAIATFEALGVSTTHEALGRSGLMKPYIRPIWAGASIAGPKATDMLSLERPALDWVALARGHGVPGIRVEDSAALTAALRRGFASRAPFLIEVLL